MVDFASQIDHNSFIRSINGGRIDRGSFLSEEERTKKMQMHEQFEGLHVVGEYGQTRLVTELWRDTPVVLGLVRHFG